MTELRALIVEDSPNDTALLVHELERGGYQLTYERVETARDMEDQLATGSWDIIFCDWNMPQFSALEALEVANRRGSDVPFIIISGSVADEVAVSALRTGAHDVFAKGNLTLLVPAVERELRESRNRRESSEMRTQLMISERLASVGLLAASVAHEINNPLAVLIGSLELARERLAQLGTTAEGRPPSDVVDEVEDAYQAACRIRDVASDLRLFARSDDEERTAVDVEQVLSSSVRMAMTEIRHHAQLRLDLAPVPPVNANASRLGQVFLNLLVNAAQSIPEGHVDANEIVVTTRADDQGRVVITIRDTGCGMPPETRDQLFTPFFTTKPVGEGTGLGLSICHRIVTAIGGTITVESEVDRGSTFRVVLPPAEVASVPEPTPAHHEPAAGRRGHVLVIDDEPGIRLLLTNLLTRSHEVTATASAPEALDWIDEGRHYDVILCDLMMPEMTGVEFFHRLDETNPRQAETVIFLTAGAINRHAQDFLNQVANPCIDKPFDLAELSDVVNTRIG